MSAFLPIRHDTAANAAALNKVREDKKREVKHGHDGTWVAHPELIPVAAKFLTLKCRPPPKKQTIKYHPWHCAAVGLAGG